MKMPPKRKRSASQAVKGAPSKKALLCDEQVDSKSKVLKSTTSETVSSTKRRNIKTHDKVGDKHTEKEPALQIKQEDEIAVEDSRTVSQNSSARKRSKKVSVHPEDIGNSAIEDIKEERNGADAKMSPKKAYHLHNGHKCYKFVGAHMSVSGGLFHSIQDGDSIGCKAIAIFLKNQRTWNYKPIEEKVVDKFKETLKEHSILAEHILPHGPYLMNCGSPDTELREKSKASLLDDATRCDKLGIQLLNFHPGSSVGKISTDECCRNIAECINFVHKETSNVILVLENMCGQGNTVGSFAEIAKIIGMVENQSRVGMCLDTCHAYAFGYDLNTKSGYEEMMSELDQTLGIKYLKGVHLNDSKGKRGCHLDRHENIGKGQIGLKLFQWIMNDSRFDGVPMAVETPVAEGHDDIYEREVALLYSLCEH